MVDEREVYQALRQIDDPELGVNVIDLGLVYDLRVGMDGAVDVVMTLTTPGCPMRSTIGQLVEASIEKLSGVSRVEVRFVWEPRWTPERLSPEARRRLGFP